MQNEMNGKPAAYAAPAVVSFSEDELEASVEAIGSTGGGGI
jgi:hypothetical protein